MYIWKYDVIFKAEVKGGHWPPLKHKITSGLEMRKGSVKGLNTLRVYSLFPTHNFEFVRVDNGEQRPGNIRARLQVSQSIV